MAASVEELIAAGMSPEAAQAVAHNLAANETVAVDGDQSPPHTPDPIETLLLSLRLDLTQAHRDTVEQWLESQNVPPTVRATTIPGTEAAAVPPPDSVQPEQTQPVGVTPVVPPAETPVDPQPPLT